MKKVLNYIKNSKLKKLSLLALLLLIYIFICAQSYVSAGFYQFI